MNDKIKDIKTFFISELYLNSIQQIWLEVRESNATAINLYDNAGFILVEQRVNYYPSKKGKEDALIMCCYLG